MAVSKRATTSQITGWMPPASSTEGKGESSGEEVVVVVAVAVVMVAEVAVEVVMVVVLVVVLAKASVETFRDHCQVLLLAYCRIEAYLSSQLLGRTAEVNEIKIRPP
mmetsp:Transcript_73582/g.149394  ORF Transcript_73582/g.149394 Transcript_73582/m.149394 type:complete len:107 (-) Transcript_73582:268-588(-)